MSAKIPQKAAVVPPKPGKDVIYVDVDDEITSIIDKVENTEQKVVALVLPKRAASLQSIVNMKLLARSAKTAGKNPVLITSEAALLPLAGAAGLHIAKNLQSKPEIPESPIPTQPLADEEVNEDVPQSDGEEDASTNDEPEVDTADKIDYDKPIGALAAAHEADNPETIDLDDEDDAAADTSNDKPAKLPKDKKNKVPNFDRFRMLLGLGVLAVIGLIVFIVLAIFVLPKATVTIQTSSEPVSSTFTLTASSDTTTLDSAKAAIPAKLESSDQTGSQQVTATGQQNNGTKATGSAKLTNCSNAPVSVPAGTGISQNGLAFITQSTVSLDSGNFTSGGVCKSTGSHVGSTNIVSQSAGAKYNTTLSDASVVSGVTASGTASGGTDSIVTILSQADVDGAKAKISTGTTADDFTKALEKKLSDSGEYVLISTLKAADPVITSTPAVGQPAGNATVTIKTTYTVLTIKNSDLSQAIQDKLSSQIDKTKQKLNGNFLADAGVTVQSQAAANNATLSIHVDTTAIPIINVATVKKQSEGKKAGEIKTVITNWPGVKTVDVKLSPFWVSKVPTKDAKVTVVLQEVKDSSTTSGQP